MYGPSLLYWYGPASHESSCRMAQHKIPLPTVIGHVDLATIMADIATHLRLASLIICMDLILIKGSLWLSLSSCKGFKLVSCCSSQAASLPYSYIICVCVLLPSLYINLILCTGEHLHDNKFAKILTIPCIMYGVPLLKCYHAYQCQYYVG